MPAYLSLLCWRPAVIRSTSVRDSTEKLSSVDKRDRTSKAKGRLKLRPIASEEPVDGRIMEEISKPSNDELSGQKCKDETDNDQHVLTNVTIEIGIQNKGIEPDEEERDMNSTEDDNKQQSTSEKSDPGQEEDLTGTSESPETQTNDQAPTPVAEDNAPASKTDGAEEGSDVTHDPERATAKTEEVLTIAKKPSQTVIITNF